jgi:hypothetical protein
LTTWHNKKRGAKDTIQGDQVANKTTRGGSGQRKATGRSTTQRGQNTQPGGGPHDERGGQSMQDA